MKRTRTLAALAAALSALFIPLVAHAASNQDLFTRSLASHGRIAALAAAFVGGLMTVGTGCVYPMIGITVSVFGARKATRGQAMLLSTSFVHGIAAFYVPLGVLAALSGAIAGSIAGNPFVIAFEVLLLLGTALSMFGLFDITLPVSLQTRLTSIGGFGLKGAFLVGLVLGPIAAPCATGPLIGILTYISRTRDVGLGAGALYVYALGMGLPFWLVGTFAISLPKGGRWMNATKNLLGVLLTFMGLYYLRQLVPFLANAPHGLPGMPWSLLALMVAGLLLGAVHLSFKDGTWAQRARQLVAVSMTALGAVWLVGYEPPTTSSGPCTPITWEQNLEAARAAAARDHRPVLLDFGATWCRACEELAHTTFRAQEVACAVSEGQFVAVKIYDDDATRPANYEELQRRYDIHGLPTVIVLDGTGREVARETEFVPADRMVSLLHRVDSRQSAR